MTDKDRPVRVTLKPREGEEGLVGELGPALSTITLEEASAALETRIYEAALFFEQLEHAGCIYGNGHHVAQKLAQQAKNELVQRWVADVPTNPSNDDNH